MTAPGRASVVSLNSNNAKNAMTKALARHGRTPQVAAERASILSGRVELRVVTDADESGAVAEAEAKTKATPPSCPSSRRRWNCGVSITLTHSG